jgi:hypothetical protein
MTFNRMRRWGGYAAQISGLLLVLASLALLLSKWVGDEVVVAVPFLLGPAKFLVVLVLIGVFVSARPTQGMWLGGFIAAVTGVQMDLANFFPPSGPVLLLIGLGIMAGALSTEEAKLRLGLWGWFGANIIAIGSVYLNFGLLLAAAVFLAGFARMSIGFVLLQDEKEGQTKSG